MGRSGQEYIDQHTGEVVITHNSAIGDGSITTRYNSLAAAEEGEIKLSPHTANIIRWHFRALARFYTPRHQTEPHTRTTSANYNQDGTITATITDHTAGRKEKVIYPNSAAYEQAVATPMPNLQAWVDRATDRFNPPKKVR